MKPKRKRRRRSLLRHPLVLRSAGWVLAQVLRLWLCTLRVHCEPWDPENDPRESGAKGRVFCFWHEDLLTLGYFFSGLGIQVLISRSRDGEVISHALETLGFRTFRGSSKRGGATAARAIIRSTSKDDIGITPDGPRGPRHEFKPGAVFLASHTGMPLIAVGLAYDRPWRLRTWDKLALPRPFSRVVICNTPPLAVPPELDKESLEQYRLKATTLLHESTKRAEALLRRWRKGEKLPLISPEAHALEAAPLRKSA